MFGAILKGTTSSFQKGMTFWRSVYVKKVMKRLAFIFEQPSYILIQIYIMNKGQYIYIVFYYNMLALSLFSNAVKRVLSYFASFC